MGSIIFSKREEGASLTLRRGFISAICLRCSDWLTHGPALVRRQPIERVVLVDRKPLNLPVFYNGRHVRDREEWNLHGTVHWDIDKAGLPWSLWSASFSGNSINFPTESDALDALSKAALLWAQQTEPATV